MCTCSNCFQHVLVSVFYELDTRIIRGCSEGFYWHEKNFSDLNFKFIPGLVIYLLSWFLNKQKKKTTATRRNSNTESSEDQKDYHLSSLLLLRLYVFLQEVMLSYTADTVSPNTILLLCYLKDNTFGIYSNNSPFSYKMTGGCTFSSHGRKI